MAVRVIFLNINLTRPFIRSKSPNAFTLKCKDGLYVCMAWIWPIFQISSSRTFSSFILLQPIWLFRIPKQINLVLTSHSLYAWCFLLPRLSLCQVFILCSFATFRYLLMSLPCSPSLTVCHLPLLYPLIVLFLYSNYHYLTLDGNIVKCIHFVSCFLECKLQRVGNLYCSSQYLQHLKQCPVQGWRWIKVYWMNECIKS